MYTRADPDTGIPTDEYMTHTNERIHRCVRIRLELEGLDLDDRGPYKATALLRKDLWRLVQTRSRIEDPIPWNASWGPETPAPAVSIHLIHFAPRGSNCIGRVNQKSVAGYGNIMAQQKMLRLSES